MAKRTAGIGTLLGLTAIVVALLHAYGALSINWPWDSANVASAETTISYDAPAQVVEIVPIALDCRARIHAEVPVEGRKEHKLFGQVYRTDTVQLRAIGDIDTCVSADDVSIVESVTGPTRVVIPGHAITFERPRVDAAATQDSVRFDKGFIGKLTDALPWVSDSEGLTAAGYTFAQQVIGGSACMEQAYAVTEGIIVDAYRDQMIARGDAPTDVEVEIVGTPDFAQNEPADPDEDFDFSVGGGAECEVAPDALEGVTQPSPSPATDLTTPRAGRT